MNPNDIDYSNVSKLIPLVMNALYKEEASTSIRFQEFRDAFRLQQIQSKAWMLQEFEKLNLDKDVRILIIGSWIGFTSLNLFHAGYKHITEVDPDFRFEQFSKHLNRFNNNFNHITNDINNIDNLNYDVIINTSCEHIADNSWFEKIPLESLVVLHSNNLEGYDHTHLSENLTDMEKKYPLGNLIYSNSLDFANYSRFMIIGKKV